MHVKPHVVLYTIRKVADPGSTLKRSKRKLQPSLKLAHQGKFNTKAPNYTKRFNSSLRQYIANYEGEEDIDLDFDFKDDINEAFSALVIDVNALDSELTDTP